MRLGESQVDTWHDSGPMSPDLLRRAQKVAEDGFVVCEEGDVNVLWGEKNQHLRSVVMRVAGGTGEKVAMRDAVSMCRMLSGQESQAPLRRRSPSESDRKKRKNGVQYRKLQRFRDVLNGVVYMEVFRVPIEEQNHFMNAGGGPLTQATENAEQGVRIICSCKEYAESGDRCAHAIGYASLIGVLPFGLRISELGTSVCGARNAPGRKRKSQGESLLSEGDGLRSLVDRTRGKLRGWSLEERPLHVLQWAVVVNDTLDLNVAYKVSGFKGSIRGEDENPEDGWRWIVTHIDGTKLELNIDEMAEGLVKASQRGCGGPAR